MARIHIEDLYLPKRGAELCKPTVIRSYSNCNLPPNIILINMNLMLVNQSGQYDSQNYLPLGVLYLAAVLEKNGYNVEFVDYQLFSHAKLFDAELFIKAMGQTASIVGFSCMSNLMPFTILCAKSLKKLSHIPKIIKQSYIFEHI